MDTTDNTYAKELSIPDSFPEKSAEDGESLKPEDRLKDSLLNGYGIYSKTQIEDARFNRFSRFGRVLDTYGRVNSGREFLFFVKPDLHLCVPDGADDAIYTLTNTPSSDAYESKTDPRLKLNPQLRNHPYFKELIDSHPNVMNELQYSIHTDDPFSHLLSFSVNSDMPLDGSQARTLDNPATIFGATYSYLQDSETSDEDYTFSLEFLDNKYLDTYHFFKAYSEYHIARKSGLITPPSMNYYRYKRLHNTMGIYKFIVAEDNETLLYWAYFWGVYPTSCPREAFQDPSFSDGLTFSVQFNAAFVEDMNPAIIWQFNSLMKPVIESKGCSVDKWMPIVKSKTASQTIEVGSENPTNPARETSVTAEDGMFEGTRTIGTLPVGALIDGRRQGQETRLKYRLRWYAPEET